MQHSEHFLQKLFRISPKNIKITGLSFDSPVTELKAEED